MNDLFDVQEFRTTWNNEFFQKNQSTIRTARRLIRKSILIIQLRSYRQLKYQENILIKELQETQHDKEILQKSFANHLHERLKILKNQMNNYKKQVNEIIQQEKNYWKQLEETLAKRINMRQLSINQHQSNSRSLAVVNATFITHIDKNNENLPPINSMSPVKIPKIRSKKKQSS